MQIRQSIPSIFNIYMVDVLCCALGCVVFLWLINVNEARKQALQAETRADESDAWRKQYEKSNSNVKSLEYTLTEKDRENEELLKKLLAMTLDRDAAQDLANLNKAAHDQAKAQAKISMDKLLLQIAAMQFDLKKLNIDVSAKKTQIAIAKKENEKWKSKYTLTELLMKRLEQDLKTERKTKKTVIKSSEELQKRLKELFANLLEERKTAKNLQVKLALSQKQIDNLNTALRLKDKTLKDTTINYADLVSLLKLANRKIGKLEDDAKNRFAGVELTGKRVIFLIDVSGSMTMSKPNVTDEKKWPIACDTVGKIMASLPELQSFQVIKFGKTTDYLFPELGKGKWLKFETDKSPAQTVKRLKQITPVGGTNMHNALEEVFRYRDIGLDTVYVISDGVPSEGPPITLREGEKDLPKSHVLSLRVRELLRTKWNLPQWGDKRVRINTIGFYFDDPQVGAFLWALARENEGSFVGLSR